MQGKAELEQLLLDVVQTLGRARLHETMRYVDERLLSRSAEDLFDTCPHETGGWSCYFKPMVELLLLEIRSVAERRDRPAGERHADIVTVMALAGF